jgi:hypothetical protein
MSIYSKWSYYSACLSTYLHKTHFGDYMKSQDGMFDLWRHMKPEKSNTIKNVLSQLREVLQNVNFTWCVFITKLFCTYNHNFTWSLRKKIHFSKLSASSMKLLATFNLLFILDFTKVASKWSNLIIYLYYYCTTEKERPPRIGQNCVLKQDNTSILISDLLYDDSSTNKVMLSQPKALAFTFSCQ